RHAHVLEGEYPVVHPVEPGLVTAVRDVHAGTRIVLLVADGHHEGVHTTTLPTSDQLGENDGHLAVTRCVADEVLRSAAMRSVDHELGGGRVVGGGRFQMLHIRTVSRLGHGEATRQL